MSQNRTEELKYVCVSVCVCVCVCVYVQNPQYSSTSTYVIYAHLLRQIAALSEADHHFLVHWLKK